LVASESVQPHTCAVQISAVINKKAQNTNNLRIKVLI
jgi:hypothetical protein